MATIILGAAGSYFGPVGSALGAAVGSFIDGALFLNQRTPPPAGQLRDINVTSATYGQPIPRVWGKTRVPAQLIYSSQLREVDVSPGKSGTGKGGATDSSAQKQATYYADFAVGICEGPVTDILTIWMNGRLVWTKNPDRTNEFNLVNTDPQTGNIASVLTGTQSIYLGTETQMPDPILSAAAANAQASLPPDGLTLADPSYASNQSGNPFSPAYRGLAYIVFGNQLLTDFGNAIPMVTIEVVGKVDGAYTVSPNNGDSITSLGFVVQDICAAGGVNGIPFLDQQDFLNGTDFLQTTTPMVSTDGLAGKNVAGYSLISQTAAVDALKPLAFAYFFYGVDSDWTLKFGLQSGTPVGAIDEDDLGARSEDVTSDVDKVKVTRTPDTDLPRTFVVRYMLSDIDYQSATQQAQRPANAVSSRLYSSLDIPITMTPDDAKAIAEQGLYLAWAGRVQYELPLPRSALLYDAGDTVTLTYNNGTTTVPMFIKNIDYGTNDVLNVEGAAIDEPIFTPAQPSSAPIGATQGLAVPQDALAPIILEPPNALTPGQNLEVWIVTGNGADPDWLGCDVLVSFDDNSYTSAGTIKGSAVMGVLAADLPSIPAASTGRTIDQSGTLQVNLNESNGTLASVPQATALNLSSLCYVDGELIAYQNAVNPFPGQFFLNFLVRGAYFSPISEHRAGSNFALLDGRGMLKIQYTQDRIGQTIFVKLLSFNKTGSFRQDITQVAPTIYTLQGSALSAPMPDIEDAVVSYSNNFAQITWTEVSDFRPTFYEIRQGDDPTSALVLGRQAHPPFTVPGNGTYLLAAVSEPTPGLTVYSREWRTVQVDAASIVTNIVASFTENPNWTGTTTFGTYKVGPDLVLGTTSPDFLDQPSFLDQPNFLNTEAASGAFLATTDFLGNNNFLGIAFVPFSFLDTSDFLGDPDVLDVNDTTELTGTYTLPTAHQVDVGRVAPCLVTMTYSGVGQLITNTGNFLSLSNVLNDPDILGAAATANIDVVPQIGLSSDGVNWNWQNYAPGVYNSRYFWARVQLTSNDPHTGAVLPTFNFTVDAPDRIDDYIGFACGSGGSTITFTPNGAATAAPFNGGPGGVSLPQIQVTIVNEQAGDQIVFVAQSLSAVTLQVKNGGTGVARSLNVHAKGF